MGDDLAIHATGLVKSYREVRVLDGLDLRVPAGSVFALLGPNGAGKTTTVRILATLSRADQGRARVAGFDVVRDRHQVRRRISLTGQFAALDEAQTGEENLRMMGALAGLSRSAARRRAAGGATFALMFFTYASSAFVPVKTMPWWLRGFASHQPATPVIETIRGLLLRQPAGTHVWLALVWCAGILGVSIAVSAVAFRRRTA